MGGTIPVQNHPRSKIIAKRRDAPENLVALKNPQPVAVTKVQCTTGIISSNYSSSCRIVIGHRRLACGVAEIAIIIGSQKIIAAGVFFQNASFWPDHRSWRLIRLDDGRQGILHFRLVFATYYSLLMLRFLASGMALPTPWQASGEDIGFSCFIGPFRRRHVQGIGTNEGPTSQPTPGRLVAFRNFPKKNQVKHAGLDEPKCVLVDRARIPILRDILIGLFSFCNLPFDSLAVQEDSPTHFLYPERYLNLDQPLLDAAVFLSDTDLTTCGASIPKTRASRTTVQQSRVWIALAT
jgi:hypothetical protein